MKHDLETGRQSGQLSKCYDLNRPNNKYSSNCAVNLFRMITKHYTLSSLAKFTHVIID